MRIKVTGTNLVSYLAAGRVIHQLGTKQKIEGIKTKKETILWL